MKINLSLIIPSYHRSELLDFGLKSLTVQLFPISYEIIILNDGIMDDTEKICNKYKKQLNIKYVFTGQRNLDTLKWRVPGAVFNEGIKLAQGEFIILSCPEIFHLDIRNLNFLIAPLINNSKLLTIPYGKNDKETTFLNYLKNNGDKKINYNLYNGLKDTLNTKLPFCMGMKKEEFNAIGGYDPAYFEGYCFDDDDFISRLLKNGCNHYQTEAKIIHLYHSRKQNDRIGLKNGHILWLKNQKIYENTVTNWKELAILNVEKKHVNKLLLEETKFEQKEEIKLLAFPLSNKVKLPLDLNVGVPQIDDNKVNQEILLCKNTQNTDILSQSIENKELPVIKELEIRIETKEKWHLEKIPKIAHFYWGEETLPYLRYLTIWSFHKYNPDWEIRFYYPKYRQKGRSWKTHEHNFKFTGKDYYQKLRKLSVKFIEIDFELIGFKNNVSEVYKANYLEYYLLYMIGGLFSDTDIIYFNSISNLVVNKPENKNINNIFSILWHGHTMGFLLSSLKNDIYKYHLDKLPIYFEKLKNDYQCIGTLMINKEIGKTIKEIQTKFPILNIYNLLPKTIYAYDIGKIKQIFQSQDIKEFTNYSIGMHWYGGYPLSMKCINQTNSYNVESNNIIGKIINISLGKEKLSIDYKNKLTIHCVVRNEPFIYYCIKAIYPYTKKILLYDTGSYDTHTLEDIGKLLEEDKERKIVFKQILIDTDETQWTMENLKDLEQQNKGKFNLGSIRQLMIDATDTEFFMVVDSDEIHYKKTMETIVNEIIPNFPEDIYLIATPINWFYDLKHTFTGSYTFPFSGGIYRTDKVIMNSISPNEHHLIKETGEILCHSTHKMDWSKGLIPYAHFETFLKPYRRKHLIKPGQIVEFKDELPEVMIENDYYIKRYLDESKGKFTVEAIRQLMKENK